MNNLLVGLIGYIPREFYYCKEYRMIKSMLKDKQFNTDKVQRHALRLQLINALENVPHYRNLKLPIKKDDITEENVFSVLKEFPYLSKKEIMENPEEFVSDSVNIDSKLIFKRTSGGSTGNGIKVYRSLRELMIERAFYDSEWGKYGLKSYSKVVRMGCDGIKKMEESPFSFKGNRMRISPYHLNSKWIKEIYETIDKFGVEFFHAYPSSLEFLAKYMKKNNLRFNTLKGIFLASERVSEGLLELLNEVFEGIPISFSYGMTERTNLAWGVYEKGKGIKYKIEDLYAFQENYIDKYGRFEIVGTSYWNRCMPFIRYRTQDYGKICDGYIEALDGRNQEFLITRNNEAIPGFTIEIDKFTWNYVETFQVVQNEVGKVEFHIVPKSNYTKEIEDKILQSQYQKWGQLFDMEIIREKEIKKTQAGKTRLVINNVI